MGEKGLGGGVEVAHGHSVGILVAGSPDIVEGYVRLIEGLLVADGISVGTEEVLHIVEVCISTVNVRSAVPFPAKDLAGGEHRAHSGPLHQALPRTRRDAGSDSLQTAHSAVAGSEEAVEGQTVLEERIQIRGNPLLISEVSHEIRAHTLDGNKDDILADFRILRNYVCHAVRAHTA